MEDLYFCVTYTTYIYLCMRDTRAHTYTHIYTYRGTLYRTIVMLRDH